MLNKCPRFTHGILLTDFCLVNSMLQTLTTQFNPELRCQRCDIILLSSKFDNIPIATKIYHTRKIKTRNQFLCIVCSLKPTNKGKIHLTKQDVEEFLKVMA